jgi:hypothetical protein
MRQNLNKRPGGIKVKMTDYWRRGGCRFQEEDWLSPRHAQAATELLLGGIELTQMLHTFIFDLKKSIIKITSKSPSRPLVRLQGKLKPKKKEYLHTFKFLLYFSVLHCTSHQLISITDSVQSVNHVKPFVLSCFFLNFVLGRGCSPGSPPSLLWVRQCRLSIKPCTAVQPTYQRLNQRANDNV